MSLRSSARRAGMACRERPHTPARKADMWRHGLVCVSARPPIDLTENSFARPSRPRYCASRTRALPEVPFSLGGTDLYRTTPGFQLRWLLLPVALVLLASNLSLRDRAYTGVSLRPDGRVGALDAGSPGHAAGLAIGDRVRSPESGPAGDVFAPGPLAAAEPGVPVIVMREE